MNTRTFPVAPGLTPAGLTAALRPHAEALAEFLVPDLRGLDAAAVYEAGSLRVDGVDAADATNRHRLHFRFAWTAQHGCSDWSCRDTEQHSTLFQYRDAAVIFEVPDAPGERSPRDEF
jgi:hypothetical protein